jgi:hypothetical protein
MEIGKRIAIPILRDHGHNCSASQEIIDKGFCFSDGPSEIILEGGTHNYHAPTMYCLFISILLPFRQCAR